MEQIKLNDCIYKIVQIVNHDVSVNLRVCITDSFRPFLSFPLISQIAGKLI